MSNLKPLQIIVQPFAKEYTHWRATSYIFPISCTSHVGIGIKLQKKKYGKPNGFFSKIIVIGENEFGKTKGLFSIFSGGRILEIHYFE